MKADLIKKTENPYEELIKDFISKQKLDCMSAKNILNPIFCLHTLLLPDGRLLAVHDGVDADPLKVLEILAEYFYEEFDLTREEKRKLETILGLLNKELPP
jgi:hypothetical protein